MESALAKLVAALASHGPGFVVAAIVLVIGYFDRKAYKEAFSKEREVNERLADRVISLATDSIKADVEHTVTIQTMSRVLDSVDRRLS